MKSLLVVRAIYIFLATCLLLLPLQTTAQMPPDDLMRRVDKASHGGLTNSSTDPRYGWISGVVTAADTGLPIPNMRVVLYFCGYSINDPHPLVSGIAGEVKTDSQGKYLIKAVAQYYSEFGWFTICLAIVFEGNTEYAGQDYNNHPYGYDIDRVPVTEGKITTGINAVLDRKVNVIGVVTDKDSTQPLEKVRVTLRSPNQLVYLGFRSFVTETDAAGRYLFPEMDPSANYSIMFETSLSTYATQRYFGKSYTPITFTPGITNEVNVALDFDPNALAGTIVDAVTHTGISSTIVTVYTQVGQSFSQSDTFKTGDAGQFAFHLQPGTYGLVAQHWQHFDQFYNQQVSITNTDVISIGCISKKGQKIGG